MPPRYVQTAHMYVGADGQISTADMQTGDAQTDAQIDAGIKKIADGKSPTPAEAGAIMAGACELMGVLVISTAGMGAILAAAIAAEWALVEGLGAIAKALGWNAKAGPGWCATDSPRDTSDSRWHHFESSGVDYTPQNGFEEFARPFLKAFWEAQNNCRDLPPKLTAQKLLVGLASIYNRTHAGPQTSYRPLSDGAVPWGGEAPWFTAAPSSEALAVNTGAPVGGGPRVIPRGGLHGALAGMSGGILHSLALSSVPSPMFSAETAAEVDNARRALSALASWLTYYGVK